MFDLTYLLLYFKKNKEKVFINKFFFYKNISKYIYYSNHFQELHIIQQFILNNRATKLGSKCNFFKNNKNNNWKFCFSFCKLNKKCLE